MGGKERQRAFDELDAPGLPRIVANERIEYVGRVRGSSGGGGGERAKGEKGWDEVNEDGRKELSGSFLIGSPATTLLSFLSLSSSLLLPSLCRSPLSNVTFQTFFLIFQNYFYISRRAFACPEFQAPHIRLVFFAPPLWESSPRQRLYQLPEICAHTQSN